MAEHDLWNEDDFFEKLKREKRTAETPKSPEPEPPQENPLEQEPLEEDLFHKEESQFEEDKPADEDIFAIQNEKPVEDELQEESIANQQDAFSPIEKEPEEQTLDKNEPSEEALEEKPDKYVFSSDYNDEKLAPVNYKPVIIGAIVVVSLIVLFFILRGLFIKSNKENIAGKGVKTKQKTEATAQGRPTQQTPIQIKRNSFLGQIAASNAYNLSLVQSIQSIVNSQKANLTNLLFYNDELTFEVFCKNRGQLAAITMRLRNTSNLADIRLVSSNPRPGDGISGVFYSKIQKAPSAGKVVTKIADTDSLQNWISTLGQRFSLKIKMSQQMGTSPAELGLKRIRTFVRLQGNYDDCLNFINAIAIAKRNIKVHKLVLTAMDQKNFSNSKYQIELTLDLFT